MVFAGAGIYAIMLASNTNLCWDSWGGTGVEVSAPTDGFRSQVNQGCDNSAEYTINAVRNGYYVAAITAHWVLQGAFKMLNDPEIRYTIAPVANSTNAYTIKSVVPAFGNIVCKTQDVGVGTDVTTGPAQSGDNELWAFTML